MRIAVLSGKGGAGKTSIAVSLALVKGEGVLVDADVEEPNAALLLSPQMTSRREVFKKVPVVDQNNCDYCKRCAEACQFNAIMVLPGSVVVFDKLCHSCGTCAYVCPRHAIKEDEKPIGVIEIGVRGSIRFIGGRLNVGEAMGTPLIRELRRSIPKDSPFVIVDAPPGVTCPVVEAVKGCDYILVVAESTVFGFHDFTLVVEFLREIGVPFGVIENKRGLVEESLISDFCESEGLELIASLPYDSEIASCYSRGVPMVEAAWEMEDLFREILERVEEKMGC